MRKRFRQIIQSRVKKIIEAKFGVQIHRDPQFGTDIFDAVQNLRLWSANDVIFDVGANDGRTVLQLIKYFPDSSIHAFEPVSATFHKLCANTEHLDNVNRYSCALGAENGHKSICLHDKPSMNSFLSEWSDFVSEERVKINTLDSVMEKNGIDFVHFLKIDTEGYEMEVLKGAQKALSSARIGIIQVEAGLDPTISPHTPFEHIRKYLAPNGYYTHGIFHQKRRRLAAPVNWNPEEIDNYRPSAIKYFDALFMFSSTTDKRPSA